MVKDTRRFVLCSLEWRDDLNENVGFVFAVVPRHPSVSTDRLRWAADGIGGSVS